MNAFRFILNSGVKKGSSYALLVKAGLTRKPVQRKEVEKHEEDEGSIFNRN
jgi:hypothetical protein